MPARIHQDYGRYLLRRGDLRETQGERKREKKEEKDEGEEEEEEEEREKEILVSVFVYHESGRAFFDAPSLAGLLYGDRLRAANGIETRSNATAW